MYRAILCSAGNPDRGQYVAVSPVCVVKVKSIEEAVVACKNYIADWDLGGGNWCGDAGKVFQEDKLVVRISYNGKINLEQ